MYMTSELCCAQWTESRSSCNGIQSIGRFLVNVVQADALQLFEPPAELVELGHHVYHVVPFLHVADNASHLEGEIITTHNDCTQPVALTAELMLELACWYLMMDSLDSGRYSLLSYMTVVIRLYCQFRAVTDLQVVDELPESAEVTSQVLMYIPEILAR